MLLQVLDEIAVKRDLNAVMEKVKQNIQHSNSDPSAWSYQEKKNVFDLGGTQEKQNSELDNAVNGIMAMVKGKKAKAS